MNKQRVGEHRGGYDPFSFDITDALVDGGDADPRVVARDFFSISSEHT